MTTTLTPGSDLYVGTEGPDDVEAGDGHDDLVGGDGGDLLNGGPGNDRFDWDPTARAGDDTFHGGAGNDEFVLDAYGDVVVEFAGGGDDTVWAPFSFSLAGLAEVERLGLYGAADASVAGNDRDNSLWGNDGAGSLVGGAGNDLLDARGGNDTLDGGTGDDALFAGPGDDRLEGGSGSDSLCGDLGNDTIDGGAGHDTARYGGELAAYAIDRGTGGYAVQDTVGAEGMDTVTGVESLRFADMTVNLVVQARAAATPQTDVDRLIELYVAFFNRVPDADGLSYWIGEKNAGQSVNQIAESFYNAGVQFSSLTGFSANMTDGDFVDVVYRNVLGREHGADAGGLAYWTGQLASGAASRGSLVSTILDSAHTFKGNPYGEGDGQYGQVADLLDNKIVVSRTFAIDWGLNYNTSEDSIEKGMAIADAITPTGTDAAIALIGIAPGQLDLG